MIVWKAIAGLVLMAAVLVLSVLAAFEWAVEGDRHGVRMGQGEDTPDRSLTSGFKYTFEGMSPTGDYFRSILPDAAHADPVPSEVRMQPSNDLPHSGTAGALKQYIKGSRVDVIAPITLENEEKLSSVLDGFEDS